MDKAHRNTRIVLSFSMNKTVVSTALEHNARDPCKIALRARIEILMHVFEAEEYTGIETMQMMTARGS